MTAPVHLTSLAEALGWVAALPLPAGGVEHVAIEHAAGRVLAEPVLALSPLPRFDTCAVDGWALRTGDLQPGVAERLPVLGRIAAGDDATDRRVAGGAMRIFTGAMMPADADAVVMQERAHIEDGHVVLPADIPPGQHIRRRGEQAAMGDVLLPPGQWLRATQLALAAGGGGATLAVRPMLRVGLLSIGAELRPPGAPLSPGAIPDQNGVMLAALLAGLGAAPIAIERVGDAPDVIEARLVGLAAGTDLLVTSGGASVGEEDHVRASLERLGCVLFARLAIKPGRPTALGRIDMAPVLALPGTPAAACTAFHLLGRPLVRRLQGLASWQTATQAATATFTLPPQPDTAQVLPVALTRGLGATHARLIVTGRSTLAALAEADALAVIAPARGIAPGDPVTVHPMSDEGR